MVSYLEENFMKNKIILIFAQIQGLKFYFYIVIFGNYLILSVYNFITCKMNNEIKENHNSSESIVDTPCRKLYKSNTNYKVTGVSGGIAEFFKINALIIRLIFVLTTIFSGWGLIAYFLTAALIPNNSNQADVLGKEINRRRKISVISLAGAALLFLSFYFALYSTGILLILNFLIFYEGIFFPLLFISIGLFVFLNKDFFNEIESPKQENLFRSSNNKIFFGVCSGMAKYLSSDPLIIRTLWVILSVYLLGLGVLIYFLFIFIVPKENGLDFE